MDENSVFPVEFFTRNVVGDYAVYDNSRLFRCGVFNDRIVNGKPLEITPSHISSIVKNFASPIGANIQHTNFLKGQAAHVMSVRQDGSELFGTVSIPLWLDEHLDDAHKKVSVELDPINYNSLVGLALCTNPAITDAQLMTQRDSYFAKKMHTTHHGQSAIQQIHDIAARSGALCDDTSEDKADFVSKPERKGLQAIHDTAIANGASCSMSGMGYYTMPLEDTTSHAQPSNDVKPTITHPADKGRSEMIKKSTLWNSFTALFNHDAIENDMPNLVDPSGVVIPGVQTVDVTKSAEFVAKDNEVKVLADKLKAIEDEKAAEFTKSNEVAVDALIASGKFDPKDKESLLVDRAASPALFDKMVEKLPVPTEFVAPKTTLTADELRDKQKNDPTSPSAASTANYLKQNGMSPRIF